MQLYICAQTLLGMYQVSFFKFRYLINLDLSTSIKPRRMAAISITPRITPKRILLYIIRAVALSTSSR